MVSMLPNNDAVILNGVYWLFATKFVFLSILMFKTFITPSHTLRAGGSLNFDFRNTFAKSSIL